MTTNHLRDLLNQSLGFFHFCLLSEDNLFNMRRKVLSYECCVKCLLSKKSESIYINKCLTRSMIQSLQEIFLGLYIYRITILSFSFEIFTKLLPLLIGRYERILAPLPRNIIINKSTFLFYHINSLKLLSHLFLFLSILFFLFLSALYHLFNLPSLKFNILLILFLLTKLTFLRIFENTFRWNV